MGKAFGIFILMALMAICMALVLRALDAPVVFVDPAGNVCGCARPEHEIPTLEACEGVDFDELHEVITVSSCRKGK